MHKLGDELVKLDQRQVAANARARAISELATTTHMLARGMGSRGFVFMISWCVMRVCVCVGARSWYSP